jgi:recombination protein RecA
MAKTKDTKETQIVKGSGEREKAVEAARLQIEKQFGKGSLMKMGEKEIVKVETISTGSMLLD